MDSPHEYFSGRARLQQVLIDYGLSYAILRPAALFGKKTDLMAYPGMAGPSLCPFRSSISIGFIYDDLSTG